MNTPVVFLPVQFCDSKEPKKIAVFYETEENKTKQYTKENKD